MPKQTPVADQIAALNELRADPTTDSARQALRAALTDRSNRVVARAAEIAGESAGDDLVPPLLETYGRLLVDPVKKDPGCVGKIAIAEALVKLECHDLDFYRSGIRHTQYEPVWGGEEDTAAPVRSASAMGMVLCASILEALSQFAELLADPHRTARIGAARAISGLGHPEGVPLVKLKLLSGDADAEVIGECCSALLRLSPEDGLRLVVPLLDSRNEDVRVQAAVALGESRQPSAFEPLQECWQWQRDQSVRKIVQTAIGILRCDEADEFLLSLIRGTNERDAADALEALAPFAKSGDLRSNVEAAVRDADNPRLRRILDENILTR
jgi:HEAT repeat protein